MKVFNPNDTAHTLKFIPREYIEGLPCEIAFFMASKDSLIVVGAVPIYNEGFFDMPFSQTFKEDDRGTVRVTTSEGQIIYRGKFIATANKGATLTQNIYYYE